MEYDFRRIEERWRDNWKKTDAYRVHNDSQKPSFYVLDMFPYPSGAGLHVGHPLGYIASDIFSRYKRLKGFNVLHPMGFDSFGLPAEQYALETGQHPAITTEKNIATFKSQLDKIGFSYDWEREVRTSDPQYYRWTQWLFLKLFNSYFCNTQKKARPIADLISKYEAKGAIPKSGEEIPGKHFTADEWNNFSDREKADVLMQRRLAYSAFGEVNWCEALGTVLANDEVVNGVSERGGHPVIKKKMRQWYLRITAYADRLLTGLDTVNFSDAMKEMQKNWIGKSEGAELEFPVRIINDGSPAADNAQASALGARSSAPAITVYTTRPDTIFGADFLVLAPEHILVNRITTEEQQNAVDEYLTYVKSRSDRERQAEVKQVTGCFTGAYAENPLSGKPIPVWIAEYVLAGYGTGAIMAVPCGDQRDFLFAKHFNIPITNIIGDAYTGTEANATKDAVLENSDFLNGLLMRDAIAVAIDNIEKRRIGKRKINYRMRDAGFSRQRYWGEPFPIVWKDDVAIALDEKDLPVELPFAEKYEPGPEGEGPLANMEDWVHLGKTARRETSTMPGYAGSSWYFLRYMDPKNTETFCDRKASDYWGQVDVYVGGTEHAVGHLLYSRMWTKVMYDLSLIGFDEPYKKLVNQGMIQGSSRFVYRVTGTNKFVSAGLKDAQNQHVDALHVDVNFVDGTELDIDAFRNWKPEYRDAIFVLEDGSVDDPLALGERLGVRSSTAKYICGTEVEKMSKSKYNTVNPDVLVDKYGADTFRMYEMFLGPVEQSKPWDTKGIEGVHRFLKKLWRLFFDEAKGGVRNNEEPTDAEWKVLHKAIKKIEQDTENFSFNTAVSAFMISVNELADLKCRKKKILSPLLILLSPYAPHIAEELWQELKNDGAVLDADWPLLEEKYLVESTINYPVSINGKMRTSLELAADADFALAETAVIENEIVQKWLEGKAPKKIIFVKGRMINVVI